MQIQIIQIGQRNMSKVGYSDWDVIVQKAEANLETLDGNKRRAEIGEQCERNVLEFALKHRDQFPKPKVVEKKEEKKEEIKK